MFENLSDKLGAVFKRLSSKGKPTEVDIDEALRQVRLALLEADVNFKVVKDFVARVRERVVCAEVMESLAPAQQVIKVVNEELIVILGGGQQKLQHASQPPTVIMLVGLQGAGKTTSAAKLALYLRRGGERPLMVAADPYRPAARDQLVALGKQLEIPVYDEQGETVAVCINAVKKAREMAASTVIIDTAGRLHVDEELMEELVRLGKALQPTEVLLVADAMTGQEAVRIASEFSAAVNLTGVILTKMDGDARGGAALSITSVAEVPIKFIGTGEKADALEPFYPDRMASRILGMGDVLTLIERVESTYVEQRKQEVERKIRDGNFDLQDFLEQLSQIKKMGPISQLVEMIPGLSGVSRKLSLEVDEKKPKMVEAIILSMTHEERSNPDIIDGSRRRRIAR
ncbi:MAG: signal recognition particle protein, partial [Dehalococcoidia bacterium]